jgi:hypothetical protein
VAAGSFHRNFSLNFFCSTTYSETQFCDSPVIRPLLKIYPRRRLEILRCLFAVITEDGRGLPAALRTLAENDPCF